MNKQALRADLLLLLTSCVWGFGFVAQRSGMRFVGPFTFNAVRFLLGSASLIPLILFRKHTGAAAPAPKKAALLSSCIAGTCLFVGVSLQQIGLLFTTAGNCGFITGLYMVLTLVFGIFLGKKTGLPTWIGGLFTFSGMFFLSAAGRLDAINPGDLITAVSAVFWAFHVLIIDRLVQQVDPLALASGQFAFCGAYSLAAALFREQVAAASLIDALIPILYGGLGSVGVGYTLQVIAQKHAPPAHAAIILCLEGVFAALGGVLILSEPLGRGTLLGFGLMFCGMVGTQWDVIAGRRPKGAA
ncbi:MAG: DMT family transporter [Spirochaetaceae bacterium]|jgi:drug/metabolite transporter (DMT)-like permease|nr:DMT family transporter [Spirochaetaceae bacterium]